MSVTQRRLSAYCSIVFISATYHYPPEPTCQVNRQRPKNSLHRLRITYVLVSIMSPLRIARRHTEERSRNGKPGSLQTRLGAAALYVNRILYPVQCAPASY
jgi:hypothetical protein